MKRLFFIPLVMLVVFSCQNESTTNSIEKERPIQPWVFRSVMDDQPRMITAALEQDLYVSYYTQSGALYKAWKGLVNFEGAVYNTAHGPQPTAVGDAYLMNKYKEPWQLMRGGSEVEASYDYKGHRFKDGHVELMYALKDASSDNEVMIYEQLESNRDDNGGLHFERVFTTEGLPTDYQVAWTGNISSVVDKSQITCNGSLEFLSEETRDFEGKEYLDFDVKLVLENDSPVRLDVKLLEPVHLDPNLDDGFTEDESSLPIGAKLIGKNDCKTCHNTTKYTVGPSYMDIAKRYEHTDENALMLTNKIKNGGTGIWGKQVMTPHPEIPDADIKEMVNYIFTLAEFEGEKSKEDTATESIQSVELKSEDLIPGAMTRIFDIPKGVTTIPANLENKTPIMAGMIPNFDNISGGDFIDLEDDFALLSNGYLHIEESGTYNFRLWSDDGSKMYLHDQLIIDHDGLHGTSMKQGKINLDAGYHPFRIEYFQGGGGKFLSWNYRPDSEEEWRVVPSSKITHHKDDHRMIGGLTLPMSVVTKIPGNGYALEDVHPSFDVSQARPIDFTPKVGGMDFMSDGRLLVSTWDTEGTINIVDGLDKNDPDQITVKEIASGLAEPLGISVVNDRIFVVQKQEITELVDTNGDDVIDEYRSFCDDWGVSSNFHEFSFGMTHKDGHIYINLATGIMPGGAGMKNQHPDRGSTLKVNVEDGSMEKIANGLRTPNGIGLGYNNEIFVADNQGDWLPSSKIVHVTKGDWFGSRAVDFEGTADKTEKKPVVWLPQDEIGNSPSTPLALNVGPYQNQMIHGEVTHGGIKRVFVEEVEGQLQGCVFRFIQGLEAGVNRLVWGPDGDLYVGGIGNPGNWQQNGKLWYGLQKLSYNETSTFEMLAVRAFSDGMEIEFTQPLKEGDGWNPADYEIRQWYYLPTADYGGPKLDNKALTIKSANVSDDRKKVFLELDGMKEDHVIYVRLKNHFVSVEENSLWSSEAWYTLNQIPKDKEGFKTKSDIVFADNKLTPYEESQGWELLFDGESYAGWRGYKKDAVSDVWLIEDGTMSLDTTQEPGGRWFIEGSNDIITDGQYENFELNLEWKIQNCGNSGIFFLVQELDEYHEAYFSGPEMQILDNVCHPETNNPTHRAGDLYDLIECKFFAVKPAGEWNKVRLIVNQGKVEHWLNGYKMLEYELWTDEWNQMIANSKFKDWPMAKTKKGHIALQEHDDKVWFKNIKIKQL